MQEPSIYSPVKPPIMSCFSARSRFLVRPPTPDLCLIPSHWVHLALTAAAQDMTSPMTTELPHRSGA